MPGLQWSNDGLKEERASLHSLDRRNVDGKNRKGQRTAHVVSQLRQEVTITHPFHPRYSEKFSLLSYGRPNGTTGKVILIDANSEAVSVPLSWTDAGEVDAFTAIASGRSLFRISDLVRLVHLVEQMLAPDGIGKAV